MFNIIQRDAQFKHAVSVSVGVLSKLDVTLARSLWLWNASARTATEAKWEYNRGGHDLNRNGVMGVLGGRGGRALCPNKPFFGSDIVKNG